ncbi:MAG TPA: hypothetical protein VLA89_02835 [Gemmatimonadales bacterium]|nr:hypothetical protein [Gemmatimonadales bacterium]
MKPKVRLHSMHGPTVFAFDSIEEGLKELLALALRNSNGGLYRLLDEQTGKEYARVDTWALYWPLNHERNQAMYARAAAR